MSIFAHLVRNKLGEGGRISAALREALLSNAWPGNVRQLEAAVEHAALFGRGAEEVGVEHVREALRACPEGRGKLPLWLATGTWDERHERFRRALLQEELERHGGSPVAAARALGMARSSFSHYRDELGIPSSREADVS